MKWNGLFPCLDWVWQSEFASHGGQGRDGGEGGRDLDE